MTVRCPSCQRDAAHPPSRPSSAWRRVAAALGWRAFRCAACHHRFHRFRPGAPSTDPEREGIRPMPREPLPPEPLPPTLSPEDGRSFDEIVREMAARERRDEGEGSGAATRRGTG